MKFLSTALVSAGLALASSAQAAAIVFDAPTHQLTPPAGVSFSSLGGSTVYGNKEGVGFIGVSGGGAGTEIDQGQSLVVNFTTPQVFSSLTFGLLYDGDEFGDTYEIAGATIDGSSFLYTLTALTATTGAWNAAGSIVTNLSPAQYGGGGVWAVSNPFGSMAVSTLTLSPVASRGGSDFGLVAFSTHDTSKVKTDVPDAGSTAAMLALGVIGMVGLSKRRKA